MSNDIESIGVEFDTSGLDRGNAAFDRLSQSSTKATAEADKLTEKLKKQAETFNMTEAEIRRYEASQIKATAAQRSAINEYLKAIEAQEKLQHELKQTQNATESMFTSFLKAEAVTMFIRELFNAVGQLKDRVIKGAADLDDFSERTGETVENLSKMSQQAFISGTSFDSIMMASDRLSKGLTKVDEETKGVGKALEFLGVNGRDANGHLKNSSQLMREVSVAMAGVEDGAGKAAIAQALFGRSGAQLLPYLKDLAAAGEINANVTTEQAAMAEAYEKKQRALQLAVENFVRVQTLDLLPAIMDAKTAFFEGAKELFGYSNASDKAATSSDGLFKAFKYVSIGAAYVLESIIGVARAVRALAGSFESVWADVRLGLEAIHYSGPMTGGLMFEKNRKALGEALDARNQTVKEANTRYSDLWNYNGTAISDAVKKSFASAEIEREAKKLEAAFGGGLDGVAGVAKKSADGFMDAADKSGKAAAKAAKEQENLIAKMAGLSPSFMKEWNGFNDLFAKGKITIEQLTDAQAHLLAQQPFFKENQKQINEETKDLLATWKMEAALLKAADAEYAKVIANMSKATDKLEEDVQKQKEHNFQIGASKEMIAALAAEKLEYMAVQKEGQAITAKDIDFSGVMTQELLDQAAAYRTLAALKRAGASSEAWLDEVKKKEEEAKKLTDGIDSVFRDGFMRMLEKGTGAWKSWTQTLVNTFKTGVADAIYKMFAQPILLKIVAGVIGSVGGSSLGSVAANAGGSMVGQFGQGLVGNFTKGVSSEIMNGTLMSNIGAGYAGVGSSFASTVGGGFATDAMGATVIEGASAATLGSGSTIGSTLATIPVYGWMAMAALAAYAIFSKKGGGPKEDGQSGVYGSLEGSLGGQIIAGKKNQLGGVLDPVVTGLQSQYNSLAKMFGGEAAVQFGMAISRDPKGKSDTFLEAYAQKDGKDVFRNINLNVGRSEEDLKVAFVAATTDSLIGALKASNLGPQFAAYFDTISGEASTEMKQAAITTATNVMQLTKAMSWLGEDFSGLSVTARVNMINLAGGLDALISATQTYRQNFFTEAENQDAIWKQLVKEFSTLGLVLPSTNEGMKNLVEGLDKESPLYMAVLALTPAFAKLYPLIDKTTESSKTLSTLLANVDKAFTVLQKSVTTEKERLEKEYRNALVPVQARIDSITTSVQRLTSLSGLLQGTLNGFAVNSAVGMGRNDASAQISRALEIARTTGVLPDAESLQNALSVVAQPSEELYGSFIEYIRAFDKQAADIQALSNLTEDQLTDQQKMLRMAEKEIQTLETGYREEVDRLDRLIAEAQRQVDAANGNTTATLSVVSALANLNGLLRAVGQPGISGTGNSNAAVVGTTAGGNSITQGALDSWNNSNAQAAGIAGIFQQYLGRSPESSQVYDYYANYSLSQVEQMVKNSAEYKGYAAGGDPSEGWIMAGEKGKELMRVAGRSRVYTTSETQKIFGGDSGGSLSTSILQAIDMKLGTMKEEWEKTRKATEDLDVKVNAVINGDTSFLTRTA